MDQQCQTCSCAYLTHRDLIICLLASQQWADPGGDCSQLQREKNREEPRVVNLTQQAAQCQSQNCYSPASVPPTSPKSLLLNPSLITEEKIVWVGIRYHNSTSSAAA